MSRQREYQKRKAQAGLCIICGLEQLPRSERCIRHYIMKALSLHGLGTKKVVTTDRSKVLYDLLISTLVGRYVGVKTAGVPFERTITAPTLLPNSEQQKNLDKVVQSIDRKAVQAYALQMEKLSGKN